MNSRGKQRTSDKPSGVPGANPCCNEAPAGEAGKPGAPEVRRVRPFQSEQFVHAVDRSPLLTARELLVALFPIEADRPSLRWLYCRMKERNGHDPIPFVKVDGIRKFDAKRVRRVLIRQRIISA